MRLSFKISIFNANQNGFTLMELLIAIAMLGILAVAAITTLNPFEQIKKGNDARRKTDIAQLQRALQMYYEDKGTYPASSADFKIISNSQTLAWGATWQPYMPKLPSDPVIGKNYVYYSPASSAGQTYYLYSVLEEGSKDKSACNSGNACQSLTQGVAGFPATTACGGTCNYGVSSSNVTP